MKKLVVLILGILCTVSIMGCSKEEKASDENASTETADTSWCQESLENYNQKSRKCVEEYEAADGETDKDSSPIFEVDKEKKAVAFRFGANNSGNVSIFTEENGKFYTYSNNEPWVKSETEQSSFEDMMKSCDIDLEYVTGYEIVGEEKLDDRDVIKVRVIEENRKTLAEYAKEQQPEEFEKRLKESGVLKKAYEECKKSKERERYIWFDARTKEPVKSETDVTAERKFAYEYQEMPDKMCHRDADKIIMETFYITKELKEIEVPTEYEEQ